jgi:hypothetical protein
MKNSLGKITLLFISLALLALPLATCGGATTQLYIDPSLVEKYPADVCTNFDLDVKVADVTDLYAFDVNITWDSSMLTLVKVMFTAQLNDMWGTWFLATNATGPGWYKLAAVQTAAPPGYTGTHVLVTLRFHVDSCPPGQTQIHFQTHKLSDSATPPNNIAHTATDGTYKMLSAPAELPVGGTWLPIDKLALMAPWIVLVVIVLSFLSTGAYLKYTRRNH